LERVTRAIRPTTRCARVAAIVRWVKLSVRVHLHLLIGGGIFVQDHNVVAALSRRSGREIPEQHSDSNSYADAMRSRNSRVNGHLYPDFTKRMRTTRINSRSGHPSNENQWPHLFSRLLILQLETQCERSPQSQRPIFRTHVGVVAGMKATGCRRVQGTLPAIPCRRTSAASILGIGRNAHPCRPPTTHRCGG